MKLGVLNQHILPLQRSKEQKKILRSNDLQLNKQEQKSSFPFKPLGLSQDFQCFKEIQNGTGRAKILSLKIIRIYFTLYSSVNLFACYPFLCRLSILRVHVIVCMHPLLRKHCRRGSGDWPATVPFCYFISFSSFLFRFMSHSFISVSSYSMISEN